MVASAGTIKNSSSSDTTGTTVIATESICPKGWSLPANKQIDTIGGLSPGSSVYVPSFSPVMGGYYGNGTLHSESIRGYWWGSTAYSSALRYRLNYYDSNLYISNAGHRDSGLYIRCVSEEKDVSDLTYMQDMTAKVAADTPEGMTASLTDRRDGKVYTVAKINGNMWMTENLRLGYDASN
ncbi:hypothetical protein IKF84_03060, partial [Candidatus Saccharibacteria bacterium]|nr:hypothetical protein [Candidatus Saccharibacteria bacterium]